MNDAMEQTPASALPEGADSPLFVKSVHKAFRLLEVFADRTGPLSLSHLAAASGMDTSGAQRLAHALLKPGYLERQPGGLRPGRRILERSFDYLRGHPLVGSALPVVSELRRSTQERVDLSLFSDLHMLYLIRLQSKRESFYACLNGRKVPTVCSSGGRAVLAQLPRPQVMDILQRSDRSKITSKTTTMIDRILKHIAQVQANGYSLALEDVMIGEIALAGAVLDEDKPPIGAIHLAGSLSEWTPDEFVRKFAPLVVDAARAVSTA